jgi:hypothetical protein
LARRLYKAIVPIIHLAVGMSILGTLDKSSAEQLWQSFPKLLLAEPFWSLNMLTIQTPKQRAIGTDTDQTVSKWDIACVVRTHHHEILNIIQERKLIDLCAIAI